MGILHVYSNTFVGPEEWGTRTCDLDGLLWGNVYELAQAYRSGLPVVRVTEILNRGNLAGTTEKVHFDISYVDPTELLTKFSDNPSFFVRLFYRSIQVSNQIYNENIPPQDFTLERLEQCRALRPAEPIPSLLLEITGEGLIWKYWDDVDGVKCTIIDPIPND